MGLGAIAVCCCMAPAWSQTSAQSVVPSFRPAVAASITTTQTNAYDGSERHRTQQASGARTIGGADGQGNAFNNGFNAQGVLVHRTWKKANGTSGTQLINADHSSVETVDSGGGNTTVLTFSALRRLTSLAWGKGNTAVTSNMSTDADGNKFTTRSNKVDNTCIEDVAHVDGSNSTTFLDSYGNNTTNNHDAHGHLVGDSWSKDDGTSGKETFNANGSPRTAYIDDGRGDAVSSVFAASGDLSGSTTVTRGVDGDRHGFETTTFTGSAITLGVTKSVATRSTDLYTLTTKNRNASGDLVSYSVSATDVGGNTTTDNYSGSNALASVTWNARNQFVSSNTTVDASGTHVTNQSNFSDKSSIITTVKANGSRTVAWDDGHGASTTNSYNTSGKLVSQRWKKADGTSGTGT